MPVEEVITDGVEGVLVPMHDPGLLAQRIEALLASPELRDGLGQRARRRALEWDQTRMLPKLEAIIRSAAVSPVRGSSVSH